MIYLRYLNIENSADFFLHSVSLQNLKLSELHLGHQFDRIIMESNDQQHKCEICENVFKTQNKLKQHFSSVHDTSKVKVFVCNICTKTFQSQVRLRNHIKTKYFICVTFDFDHIGLWCLAKWLSKCCCTPVSLYYCDAIKCGVW